MKRVMIRVALPGPPSVSTFTRVKLLKEPITVTTTRKNVVGEIMGRVMRMSFRHAPAPSISAHSYSSLGTS